MSKIIIYVIVIVVILGAVGTWYVKQLHDAELRGVDKQIAAEIAKSNQNIAERRSTDAHFDKYDAAAVCHDFGLQWVFADGKSHCE
jgi:hypothetical protein